MKRWSLFLCLCSVVMVAWAVGCQALEPLINYPTKTDVNNMRESDIEHRTQLADALAKLMSDEHAAMSPQIAEALAVMNQQYVSVSAELKEVAALIQAEGVDGQELIALLVASFPGLAGIGLFLKEKTKPSRSADKVAKLELQASEAKDLIHDMKVALATAAGSGDAVPTLVS